MTSPYTKIKTLDRQIQATKKRLEELQKERRKLKNSIKKMEKAQYERNVRRLMQE